MIFSKKIKSPHSSAKMVKHSGKGASEQMLPSRTAMNSLTKGSPMDRTMNNYAKATPAPSPVSSTTMDADDDMS